MELEKVKAEERKRKIKSDKEQNLAELRAEKEGRSNVVTRFVYKNKIKPKELVRRLLEFEIPEDCPELENMVAYDVDEYDRQYEVGPRLAKALEKVPGFHKVK